MAPREWPTPASTADRVLLADLTFNANDSGELIVSVDARFGDELRRVRFAFSHVAAFRLREEPYCLSFWERVTERTSWTMLCPPEDWIVPLAVVEPLLPIQCPALEHFVIGTEDELIEVLSDAVPRWSESA
jgi:hypothetical protein